MAKWRIRTLQDIPGISETIGAIDTAVGSASEGMDIISNALETLSAIVAILPTSDDLVSPIQALTEQIFNLFQTGVYFYHDEGPMISGNALDGLDGFLARWNASFEDTGDSERPMFIGNVPISCVMLVAGANDIPSLGRIMPLFSDLFGFDYLKVGNRSENQADVDFPALMEESLSTPPDWHSRTVGDALPLYGELQILLDKIMGMLSSSGGWSAQIETLTKAIERKAEQLNQLSNELSRIGERLGSFTKSGIIYLQAEATNVDDLREMVTNADRADLGLTADAYVAGVCMLAGGADANALSDFANTLFGG